MLWHFWMVKFLKLLILTCARRIRFDHTGLVSGTTKFLKKQRLLHLFLMCTYALDDHSHDFVNHVEDSRRGPNSDIKTIWDRSQSSHKWLPGWWYPRGLTVHQQWHRPGDKNSKIESVYNVWRIYKEENETNKPSDSQNQQYITLD